MSSWEEKKQQLGLKRENTQSINREKSAGENWKAYRQERGMVNTTVGVSKSARDWYNRVSDDSERLKNPKAYDSYVQARQDLKLRKFGDTISDAAYSLLDRYGTSRTETEKLQARAEREAARLKRDQDLHIKMLSSAAYSDALSDEARQQAFSAGNRYQSAKNAYENAVKEQRERELSWAKENDLGYYYKLTMSKDALERALRGYGGKIHDSEGDQEKIATQRAAYRRALELYADDEYQDTRKLYAPSGSISDQYTKDRDEGRRKYEAYKASGYGYDDAVRNEIEKEFKKYGMNESDFEKLPESVRNEFFLTAIRRVNDSGYYKGVRALEENYTLQDVDRDVFFALYNQDPKKAESWLDRAKKERDTQRQAELAEFAGDNALTRTASLIGGTVLNLESGVARLFGGYNETAAHLNRMGQALISGGAQGLTEKGVLNTGLGAGTIELPIIGEKGLGDLYQLGSSMLESGAVAATAAAAGDYGSAAATVASFLGTTIMGSAASVADFESCLNRGMTRQQAATHATAAGIAEAACEYLSVEKLINQDVTKGFVKNFFLQGGVEASEELCTSIVNSITDGYYARKDGYDTQIEYRMKELMALGVDRKEAERKAEREWITDLVNDGLGGFLSGGMMTAGNTAAHWKQYKAANRYNEQTGQRARESGEIEALRRYAESNDLGWYGAEQSTEVNADSESVAKSKAEQRQERMQDRQTGSDINRVQEHMEKQLSGKSVQEQQAVVSDIIQRFGDAISPSVYDAVTAETARSAENINNADELLSAKKAATEQADSAEMRQAIRDGYDLAALRMSEKPGGTDFTGRYLQQSRNTGTEEMRMMAELTDASGNKKTVKIEGFTEDGKSVRLEDGSTVAADALQSDIDTVDAVRQISNFDMGKDADAVLQAYFKSGETGTNGYRWLMDYATAYEQGRTNRISLKEAVSRSSLDAESVMSAYALGQKNAHAETKRRMERIKSQPLREGASGRTAKIDVSEISGKTLSASELDQFEIANKVFELVGVDVKWFSSTEKNGKFVGKNGAYENGTVYLDIHAGRNFINDVNSGILATTGHELTHFLQQYAPDQYQSLKEFIFQQIVKSGKNGEMRLERLIWEKQRRSSSRLSRKAAEDEVAADACQTILRDSRAIHEFAKQDAGAVKGIARWLDGWFKKLQKMFDGSAKLSEEAQIMDNLAKDVREAFGTLWDDALREAVRVHDEIGNMESPAIGGGGQYMDRSYAEQVDEVLANTFDNQNKVYMGTTPTRLSNILGLPKIPMLTTPTHVFSMAMTEAQAMNDPRYDPNENYHGLGDTMVKNLPEIINKPVLIIKSNMNQNDARFVVVTNQKDSSGDPIIAAIEPNGKGKIFNLRINENAFLSGYGKHNFRNYLTKALNENRILYAYKNSQQKNSPWLQLPNSILSADYTHNLSQFKQIVNQKFAGTMFRNNSGDKYTQFSDRDYLYSERDEFSDTHRGNGYDGYSMSVNAREAYERGEMPKSKWNKSAILDAVAKISEEKIKLLQGVNVETLREHLLESVGWHHTSSMYNKTPFFAIDEIAVEKLTADDVAAWNRVSKKQTNTNAFRGDFYYIEWSGSRNHPKADNKVLRDVNIQEKGAFYIVTDDEGNMLVRKKIGSNGTRVTDYAQEARRREAKQAAEQRRIDNSTEAANALYTKMKKAGMEYSTSGNIYFSGRKPTQSDYALGIENFFHDGEQRLSPNYRGGYVVDTFRNGNWVREDEAQRNSEEDESIRYSERDYSGKSDLDLLEQADEDWTEERWKEILNNAPELEGREAELRQALQAVADSSRKIRELTEQVKQLNAEISAIEGDNRELQKSIRGIRDAKSKNFRQLAKEIQNKRTLERKLDEQLERERKILSGRLKPPSLQSLLKAEREAAVRKMAEHKDEVFAGYKERKERKALRDRISNLKSELQRRLTNPTDRSYVPAELATALVDALDAIDTSPKEGTKAAEVYQSVSDKLRRIAEAYQKLTEDDEIGWEYKSEYDETIKKDISNLANSINGRKLKDLSRNELEQVYGLVRTIRDSMRQATKLIGKTQFADVRAAIHSLVEQQSEVTPMVDAGFVEQRKRRRLLSGLSPMRAVEMMGSWDRNSALYQMFQAVEHGATNATGWTMGYHKRLQPLKTGKNELSYRNAMTKLIDFGAVDKNNKPVRMTKMQAIQLLMTWQREQASDGKLVHLQKGGAVIRDARAIQSGNSKHARSQTIDVTPALIQRIQDRLTDWDRSYIGTVRDYLAQEGKATNRVLYALKHRVLPLEENYMPYSVDKAYLETKLEGSDVFNLFVKTPGSTNEIRRKAPQPVIIDGADSFMSRHVKEIANYIGLAIPIRDFAKLFNGRISSEDGSVYTSVKKTIEDNFGQKGNDLILQALLDVQGGTKKGGWSADIADYLNKLHGSFVRSALIINPSVTMKQAASYIAAESVVSHTALELGNRAILSSDDSKSPSLIVHLFAAPEGGTATRLYNEIDEHTSMHWERRQGMSHSEIAEQAQREGAVKRRLSALGARMEQRPLGHKLRKAGASIDPLQWIQRMDVATTATLWVACKEQARLDGFTSGTPEFWNRTTELYERCLRETQPMYDSLHRTAVQKMSGGIMQYLFPFRTVPIQNHGQLVAAYESMKAAKGKSKAEKTAATKHFAKTVWAQTESAVVFSLFTLIAAGLKRKTKKYRDDNEELTPESIAKGFGSDVAGTLVSVLLPVYGSELWTIGNRYLDKLDGKSGYSYDAFSVGVVDMLNDLASAGDALFSDAGKALRGENVNREDFLKHAEKLLFKGAKVAGIPLDTIKTYSSGLLGNLDDIEAGRIPAFNDESWERSNSLNATRYLAAWTDGDTDKLSKVLKELRNGTGEDDDKVRNSVNSAFKNAYDRSEISLDEYTSFVKDSGLFDTEKQKAKIRDLVRDAYVESNKIGKDEAIKRLTDSGFYSSQDALTKVVEWEEKKKHAGDEDFTYSKYGKIYDAIDANKDIKELVAECKTLGCKEKDIESAVKEHLIERFVSGKTTEDTLKNQLSRYCGIVNKEDVGKIVNNAKCRKSTGYSYSDLGEAYRSGKISAQATKQSLIQYGGLSADDAKKKLRWYDLQKANPKLEINESVANSWYDGTKSTIENGHESAKKAGLSISEYIRVKEELSNVKGTDRNGDGKSDSGTKEVAYIQALVSISWLTDRQRAALYYETYKGTSKTSSRPF